MSVCGTGTFILTLEVFLGSLISHTIRAAVALRYYQALAKSADFPAVPIPTPFNVLFRQYAVVSLLRHPIENKGGTGILTRCPSTTPFGFALGPD